MPRAPDTAFRRLALTCAGLGLALSAHIGHVPVWILLLAYAAIGWRLWAQQRGFGLPPRLLLFVLVAAVTLPIVASYRTLNGLEAGTALLVAMGALKLLETRTARDHAILVFIGYFLCLASLLYEASVLRLVHALLCAWLLTAGLLESQRPAQATLPVAASGMSLRLLALGLPLTAILFLFVPRLEGHFWALPTAASQATSGISEEMNPGAIARLALSDEPAFRVQFTGPPPARELRYWRALVLDDFDGHTWRRAPQRSSAPPPALRVSGARYTYTVSLEPTQQTWLPALEHLLAWQDVSAVRAHDDVWLSLDPKTGQPARVTALTIYTATSAPVARVDVEPLEGADLARQLALPAGGAPRAIALARSLRGRAADPRAYIGLVLGQFRDEPFYYTLEPPTLGANPVDEFLFDTRAGFCEHYASAFTVLMRAAGIPARVVVGYQGGELNPYGGYLLVRQASAHAWSEVWLKDEGWVRIDPTAAVSPERIRAGADGALPGEEHRAKRFLGSPWLLNARDALDALRTGWNHAIVGFSAAQQDSLLDKLGWVGSPVLGLALALTVGLGLAGLALAGLQAWRRRASPIDPVTGSWRAICARLARAGCPRRPYEGPVDYATRVALERPADATAFAALARSYVALRYEPAAAQAAQAAFVAAARRFRPRPPSRAQRRWRSA